MTEYQGGDGHTKVIVPSRPQSVCVSAQAASLDVEFPDAANWL